MLCISYIWQNATTDRDRHWYRYIITDTDRAGDVALDWDYTTSTCIARPIFSKPQREEEVERDTEWSREWV